MEVPWWRYKGWAIFDVDAIGGNLDLAVDDYIAHNINYLRDVLGVRLPPPGVGQADSLRGTSVPL